MKWVKDCTRFLSEEDVEIWKRGDKYLSKMLGVKFASKFERDEDTGKTIIYYEQEQGEELHNAICKFLEEDETFDLLCDDFVGNILDIKEAKALMMPFLIIADEIDQFNEIASPYILRRLKRIRESTHEESYK